MNSDADLVSSSNYCRDGDSGGENGDDSVEDWDEDEETDDEYESIQRAAFKVEGEPDFESGPPEDGLEYLRRVRYSSWFFKLPCCYDFFPLIVSSHAIITMDVHLLTNNINVNNIIFTGGRLSRFQKSRLLSLIILN